MRWCGCRCPGIAESTGRCCCCCCRWTVEYPCCCSGHGWTDSAGCCSSRSVAGSSWSACRAQTASPTFTWYDTGPVTPITSPRRHRRGPAYVRAHTVWPTWNCRGRPPAASLWSCRLSSMSRVMLGCSRSSLVRIGRPNITSAGGRPVTACGAVRYVISTFWTRRCSVPPSCAFARSPSFSIRTARSAAPLLAGWYGAVLMCRTPFTDKKLANSADVNCGPLSVTT